MYFFHILHNNTILCLLILFWLAIDWPSGLISFVPALLLSILTPLFLPSSSVSLFYFILAVPMRECLGKHSCMSSQFPIAILNGTSFLSLWYKRLNMPTGHYYRHCSWSDLSNHLIKKILSVAFIFTNITCSSATI